MCTHCGERPPAADRSECFVCGERRRERDRALQADRRAAGFCGCGRKPLPGRKRCERCTRRLQATKERRRARRDVVGQCQSCESQTTVGHKHCEQCREAMAARARSDRADLRKTIFDHYGLACICCGESEPRFLTIDHKDNNGAEHRRHLAQELTAGRRPHREMGGVIIYRWLIKNGFPDGYETKCTNCNTGRHQNGGICPHQLLPPGELEIIRTFNRSLRTQVIDAVQEQRNPEGSKKENA